MQKKYALIMCHGILLLILGVGLSACGDSDDSTPGEEGVTEAQSNREGYEWPIRMMDVEVSPDLDPSVNGNMEVDPAEVDVQFRASFKIRPDNDSTEEEEVAVTDGTVRIGLGDEGASDDADFEWIELTHQGDGVYSAPSRRGLAAVYRSQMEAPGIKKSTLTLKPAAIPHILSPVQGESYSRREALGISFEPIESNTMVEALLDGRFLNRASQPAEQEELAISAAWLNAGAGQTVGLKRMNFDLKLGSVGQSSIVFTTLRQVDVDIH